MSVQLDPDGHETATLFDLVDLGDGRLTWRYAEQPISSARSPSFAESIDPCLGRDSRGGSHRQGGSPRNGVQGFARVTDASMFDVAILSWSLC